MFKQRSSHWPLSKAGPEWRFNTSRLWIYFLPLINYLEFTEGRLRLPKVKACLTNSVCQHVWSKVQKQMLKKVMWCKHDQNTTFSQYQETFNSTWSCINIGFLSFFLFLELKDNIYLKYCWLLQPGWTWTGGHNWHGGMGHAVIKTDSYLLTQIHQLRLVINSAPFSPASCLFL